MWENVALPTQSPATKYWDKSQSMKCTALSKLLLVLLIMPPLVSLFLSTVSCKGVKYTDIPMATAGLKNPLIQHISLQDAPAGFQHMNETENQSNNP